MKHRKYERALLGSGSSTKIIFMGGMTEALVEKHKYDAYVGTSGTAIVFPLTAAGKIQEVRKLLNDFKLEELYFDRKVMSFNKKGDLKFNWFNAALSLFLKRNNLSTTKGFRSFISDLFTVEDFEDLKKSNTSVFLGICSMNTRRAVYINNNDYNYDEFIDGIIASSNMPIFTEPIRIRDTWCVDGGVVDHFGGAFAAYLKPKNIDAILSRPESPIQRFAQDNCEKSDEDWKDVSLGNMLKVAQEVYGTIMFNTSIEDEHILRALKDEKDIKSIKAYYAPYKLSDQFYDNITPELVDEWWGLGNQVINKEVVNGNKCLVKIK